MKKIKIVLLIIGLIMSLCACGGSSKEESKTVICSNCGSEERLVSYLGADGQYHGYDYCDNCGNREREW